MAGASEETGEEVERIMATTATTALLMLFQSFMAVLVVDSPCFRGGEGIVGFGNLNEFLGRGFVATVFGSRLAYMYLVRS